MQILIKICCLKIHQNCFIQTKPPSVYQSQYYTWNLVKTTRFYSNSSISTLSLTLNKSELFTWFQYSLHDFLSCSLEVKNHLVSYIFECNLFLIFNFHFFLFSSDRESEYNKVGILFINTTDFFFPNWM